MRCLGCKRWVKEIPERIVRFPGGLAVCASCVEIAHDILLWRCIKELVRPDEWEGGICP